MLEDIYMIGYLIFSSIVLLYMMTFIKPEIEEDSIKKVNSLIPINRVNPYLPFCISSPLMSSYNYNKV